MSYRAPGHRQCSKCLGTMSLSLKGHKFRRQEVTTEGNEMDTKGKERTGNMGIGRLGEQGRIKSTHLILMDQSKLSHTKTN